MGLIAKIAFPIAALHDTCEEKCSGCPVRFERRIFSSKRGNDLYLLQPDTGKVIYFSNSDVTVPESVKSGFICLSGMEDVKGILSVPVIH